MTIQQFHKGLRTLFGIENPGDYLEKCLLPLRIVSLDILKLDDWLHEKIGDYEKRGMNMDEAITTEYSSDASRWVQLAILSGGD